MPAKTKSQCPLALRRPVSVRSLVMILFVAAFSWSPLHSQSAAPNGITLYGVSTPGCQGAITIGASGSMTPGSDIIAFADGAPPNVPALLIVGTVANFAGTIIEGIRAHVELIPGTYWGQSTVTDSQGRASVSYRAPANAPTYYAQFVFFNPAPCAGASYLCSSNAASASLVNQVPTHQIGRYEVFEATIVRPVNYGTAANFRDVEVNVVIQPPSGAASVSIGGFYEDSPTATSSHWKFRYAPKSLGTHLYTYTWRHVPSGTTSSGSGSFLCVSSSNPGFVGINPANPFRLQFSNGAPFHPVGWNYEVSFDGGGNGFNSSNQPNPGAFTDWLCAMAEPTLVIDGYTDAGFDLVRFKNKGPNSEALCDATATVYNKDVARLFDERLRAFKSRGVRILYGIWGNALPNGQSTFTEAQRKFVKYSIDRFGAYVDIWQIQNEKTASAAWVSANAQYIKSYDPYRKPVTQSWETPSNPDLDMLTPHKYVTDIAREADATLPSWLNLSTGSSFTPNPWKSYGKPIIIGECGQMYRNWDQDSRVRTRLRAYSALFHEAIVCWFPTNLLTTWTTNGVANVYLGRDERMDQQILKRFTDAVLRSNSARFVPTFNNTAVRGFGLSASGHGVALYVNHWFDHNTSISNTSVTFTSPVSGQGRWINPASGQILGTTSVVVGSNTQTIPTFTKDIMFFAQSAAFEAAPLALFDITNPQADGDLDNDGRADTGPANQPFGIAPLSLSLSATRSIDWDGGAVTCHWDFGDGTSATGAATSHTFARGTWNVTLTVTDNEGRTARQRFIVRAMADPLANHNEPPVFSRVSNVIVREGEPLHLMPTAMDPELQSGAYTSTVLSYSAQGLPAGSLYVPCTLGYGDFLWTPRYDQAGTYVITFRAQDAAGAFSTVPVTITVVDTPPIPGSSN